MFTQTSIRSLMMISFIIIFGACQKDASSRAEMTGNLSQARNNELNGHLKQTKTVSSEVVTKWLQQQLNMFRLPLAAGTSAPPTDRAFAYSGIALYEAVVPGMPAHQSLGGQLTDFPEMPATTPGLAYHWGASANAALAAINKNLFSNTSAANKLLMEQLESEFQAKFASETDPQILHRSVEFGRSVAQAIWAWAQTDGTSIIAQQPVYSIPVGFGKWEATSAGAPANAYHHLRRQMVASSREGAASPGLAFPFNTAPGSEYYNMAHEVYQIVKNLSPEQRNIALYHREGGAVNGGSYGGGASIAGQLSAVLKQANASLDVAAEAYAKVGIGSWEGLTFTFMQKYQMQHLVMRPVTYIRAYIDPAFNTVYGTPLYPEYPAGHPTNGGMLAVMLTNVFGNDFSFNVDYYGTATWGANGIPPRHYDSFEALAQEMAIARVYSGIHFKPGVHSGVEVGKNVATNILNQLKFRK